MSAERAISLIQDYFDETIKDIHGRYMSWRYCYKAFSERRNEVDEQTIDYLALHLAFYLASWGMYRGSSFLLQKDYKIHIPIVRIIQEVNIMHYLGFLPKTFVKKVILTYWKRLEQELKSAMQTRNLFVMAYLTMQQIR